DRRHFLELDFCDPEQVLDEKHVRSRGMLEGRAHLVPNITPWKGSGLEVRGDVDVVRVFEEVVEPIVQIAPAPQGLRGSQYRQAYADFRTVVFILQGVD